MEGSPTFRLVQRHKFVMRHLCNWNKQSFGNMSNQIKELDKKLEAVQLQLDVEANRDLDNFLRRDELLEYQEEYWEQRAKQSWIRQGDRKKKDFHRIAPRRKSRNFVTELVDNEGNWIRD